MPTPRRARGLAAERAILDATLQILHEGGYSALTIDRVAATARASKTTIYRRWKTKEHLVLAVFEELPIAVPQTSTSLQADLLTLFRQFASIMQASPLRSVLPSLVAECVDNPALSAALVAVNDRRRVPLRQVIEHAKRRGELPREADVELMIDAIQGAISIRLYFLLDTLSETWIRGLVQLLLDGARRAPPVTTPAPQAKARSAPRSKAKAAAPKARVAGGRNAKAGAAPGRARAGTAKRHSSV